ncbi:MAG: ring-1,2-phenylacetyl-CoA epoxidase subunit PaaB [Bacteroidia bacterium]|jgi:ring-1,2-phenylacetyl-CoA epoxidase subunit PaaB
MIKSLDPRIARAQLDENEQITPLKALDQFQTFEVFHQKKRGQHHIHVGAVHAPNAEMALLYAKEQYARRGMTSNLWVAPSTCMVATEYFDEDIFETTDAKTYRDPGAYKVIDRINAYKARIAAKK